MSSQELHLESIVKTQRSGSVEAPLNPIQGPVFLCRRRISRRCWRMKIGGKL
jgi:hypothetical protein